MSDEITRIQTFLRQFNRRRSPRVVDVAGGFAVLDDTYNGSHDDNKLIVWEGQDAQAVMDAADELLAEREHRYVVVDDDELGRRFAPAFAAAGYQHETNLVMVFRGEFPATPPVTERVDVETMIPVLRAEWREILPDVSDEVVDQLAQRIRRRPRGAERVEFFGLRGPDGRLGARADLYAEGGIAQIETLYTEPAMRGRGLARTLMTSLLAETAGNDLVFLVADDDDWPKEFYGRLGFEPLTRSHGFLRLP
ncbi:MAG: GNAT family N-acetyltransferase [Nonomuraea sp.]|nr:GNAT family N-acetyltransferase [Nonomuraea sp.]